MSLRVWLPLNGSLENKGLDDVAVTNNGAVVNNNGKIGKCYSFGTENSYITVDSEPIKHFIEFSFACWVKIISWNSAYATIFAIKNSAGIAWNNLIFSLLREGSRSYLDFNIDGSNGYTSSSCHTKELNLNTWYHIAGTYRAGEIKLYQDGILVSTYETAIVPAFNAIDNFWIGKANANSYQSNILLNDFRIYDHALSPMEVKQISQGLVLHYPLNHGGLGQENLLVDTYNWATLTDVHTISEGYWYSNGGTAVRGYDNINNITYCKIWHSDNSSWTRYSRQYITMQPNTYYTVSILCRINTDIAHLSIRNDRNVAITFFANNVELTNKNWEWKFFTAKTHTNTSQEPFTIYAQVGSDGVLSSDTSINIAMIKLEEGTKATPWSPASSDDLYSIIGGNDTIEYDCSGYGNNGTKIGTLDYSSDTPRYDVSTHFGATNSKIRISNLITTGFSNSYTFSWWGKYTTLDSSMFWGFQNGVRLNGVYLGIYWNTGDGNSNPIYKPGTTTVVTAPEANVWHHYVMTGDNTVCKLYVDGELYGQAKVHKTISGNIIYINGWDGGTSYSFTDMDMSDFRVYCTALSPEDVLDLYNLGTAIDTNNNLYTYEVTE